MKKLQINQNPEVALKLQNYSKEVQAKLGFLRRLILETATEIDSIDAIEETLKWGEASYLVKKGSTIRIDWKAKTPKQYAMYFKCTSKLVSTFKAVYGDTFKYEKNRAIVFDLVDQVPEVALKDCISLALQYHLLKDKPLLGK